MLAALDWRRLIMVGIAALQTCSISLGRPTSPPTSNPTVPLLNAWTTDTGKVGVVSWTLINATSSGGNWRFDSH